MNCKDLEVLLSAYADGELPRTQKEFIEEHLSGCADCRETLAQFETAGRQLSSLREVPAVSDISKSTLSKIKAADVCTQRDRRHWLRPVVAAAAIVAVIAILLVAQPWSMESPEAMAASIVRNSPEVQTALNGEEIEEIEEVEVTTKVVDEENNVLMMLVKTEERVVAAEVNLEKKKVTEIVRVEVPDFQPGDEQKAIDIARADPRVQEVLAQGGKISKVHLLRHIDIAEVTSPDGIVRKEGTVILTALLTIEQDKYDWNILINLQKSEVASIGRSQPSATMTVVDISRFLTRFVAPVLLFLGILLISGLSFSYRRAKTIAGTASLALGIIGLFMALYSLSSIWWRQVLSVGIPAEGLVIGIACLRQQGRRRWIPVTGIVLGSLALLLVLFNAIMLNINSVPGENIIRVIGIAAVIAGIIIYAFKEQIMTLSVSGQWLRPAAVAVAAVVVLILALVQPWSVNPEGVIAKAYSATEGLLSYRATISSAASEGNTLGSVTEFVFPDRFHAIITSDGETDEFIVVGDKQYVKSGSMSRNMIIAFSNSATSMLSKEAALKIIDSLTSLQSLPNEEIEGIDSYHYKGKIDVEQQIAEAKRSMQESRARLGMERPTDEEIDKDLEKMRSVNILIELWIGKNDNLIRRMVQTTRFPDSEGRLQTSGTTLTFYDFNEPIIIEPPLDADGQLLAGWQLAGSITPDSKEPVFGRNITSSIGTQEGYDDWAHQEVKYSITITNNSIETVKDVRISIATMLTDEANKPARVEAKPETPTDVIAPGESRTFHARCPFDASGYTKEDILELQEVTTILVHFTTEGGQELTELLYPNAPYPTKTPPANPPRD